MYHIEENEPESRATKGSAIEDALITPEVERLEELELKGYIDLTPSEHEEHTALVSTMKIQYLLTIDPSHAPNSEDFDNIAKGLAGLNLEGGEVRDLNRETAKTLDYPDGFMSLSSAIYDFVETNPYIKAEFSEFSDGTMALHFENQKNRTSNHYYYNENSTQKVEIGENRFGRINVTVYRIDENGDKVVNTASSSGMRGEHKAGFWTEIYPNGESVVCRKTKNDERLKKSKGFDGLLEGTQEYSKNGYSIDVFATGGVENVHSDAYGKILPSRESYLKAYGSDVSKTTRIFAPGSKPVLIVEYREVDAFEEDFDPMFAYAKVVYHPFGSSQEYTKIICHQGTDEPRIIDGFFDGKHKKISVPPNHHLEEYNIDNRVRFSIVENLSGKVFYELDVSDDLMKAREEALKQAERNRNAKTREEFEQIKKSQYDGIFSRWKE